MEIRTKHLRASFEAGFKAGLEVKPMEIEAKQYDKEGALFWSSKRKKKLEMQNFDFTSSSFDSQLFHGPSRASEC